MSKMSRELRSSARALVRDVVLRRPGVTCGVVHAAGSPPLFDLWRIADSWNQEPAEALTALLAIPESEARCSVAEARDAISELLEPHTTNYPATFAVETRTAILLHAITRCVRPGVMVETGVADGLSTAVVLHAMHANDHGTLHSIDIADDVGSLVDNHDRWTLHVVAPNQAAVAAAIRSVGPIDMFLHDSDHRYGPQLSEYTTAWRALRPGGILMSDDIDWSYAFIDFANDHDDATIMMLDTRKVVGLLVKSCRG